MTDPTFTAQVEFTLNITKGDSGYGFINTPPFIILKELYEVERLVDEYSIPLDESEIKLELGEIFDEEGDKFTS